MHRKNVSPPYVLPGFLNNKTTKETLWLSQWQYSGLKATPHLSGRQIRGINIVDDYIMRSRAYISGIGLEGALAALSPVLLLLAFPGLNSLTSPVFWRLSLAILSTLLCCLSAFTLFRSPRLGKLAGVGAALAGFGAVLPYLVTSPAAALASAVVLVFIFFTISDFAIDSSPKRTNHADRCLQRALWAALSAPVVIILLIGLVLSQVDFALYCTVAASCIAQFFFIHWSFAVKRKLYIACAAAGMTATVVLMLFQFPHLLLGTAIAVNLLESFLLLRQNPASFASGENWWEMFINHPGRILFTTFFSLCLLGTLLLIVPASTAKGTIAVIDSAFTSVSAVCVTGLAVLDTPNDFTLLGQFFILVMIQLGGLGIMSITTVAMHVMGRRLSLRHEKLLASMTDTSHQDVVRALATILKFTFTAEALGTLVLTLSFYLTGDQPLHALWRGLFTAVSAFCNAGFALQSDSLIPFQTNPLVLHTVALLIIFGGIAPATSLAIPRWLSRKSIPIPAKIALLTSLVLLAAGTIFVLIFEWNGVLAGLSIVDKIQNAWFQSATLRTAGFNSVDIAGIANSTFLVMLFFMFVGGSPGGTAGGIKTTTVAILAMTFFANAANREQIIIQHRRLHHETVYRAITIVVSGCAVWFLVVIMLTTTQSIGFRNLIFEATSAIGTVGLSTGATALLDEIGKVIIMIAMFIGRIGPLSLFMLLSNEQSVNDTRYPVERISIT